ncbi:hypothetical protein ACJQWY_02255 [Weissella kandleri]|uniref:hypothetical protein n=1 Tax=Weissella kandleri TaxID=1616 RepID=UPI00387E3592
MFGSKTKKVGTISGPPVGPDIYTAPDDLGEEPVEPFTAEEALNRTVDEMDEAFELLRDKAFKEINEAIKRGEYQTELTTYFVAHDVNAKRLADYLIRLGYKAELGINGLYAGQELLYQLVVNWGEDING